VSRVNEKRTTDETAPPFAIDGSIPMEDDTYNASPGEQDSGLEENTIEELQDDEPTMSGSPSDEPPKIVNLFA